MTERREPLNHTSTAVKSLNVQLLSRNSSRSLHSTGCRFAVERPAGGACECACIRSTEIVRGFWDDVWNAHEPDAVDRFVADAVVVEAGGQEISGKDNIKSPGERVSRPRQRPTRRHHRELPERGRHPRHVPMGADGDEQRHSRYGTRRQAHCDDRHRGVDGRRRKLQRDLVEQASFELYHRLLAK